MRQLVSVAYLSSGSIRAVKPKVKFKSGQSDIVNNAKYPINIVRSSYFSVCLSGFTKLQINVFFLAVFFLAKLETQGNQNFLRSV